MNYTTLFFDADNTLLDFTATETEALQHTFKLHGFTFEGELKKRYHEINGHLWRAYENGMCSREEVVNTRFVKLFHEFDISLDGVQFEQIYQSELGKSHILMKDALEVIDTLAKKFDLYIVTNGVTATQYSRLRDSGLRPYFKDVFVSDEIGYRKPMKEYFDYCLSKIEHVKKEEILLIGDSLSSDIVGGTQYGIDTCWMNPKGNKNIKNLPIRYEIQELKQLYQILDVENDDSMVY